MTEPRKDGRSGNGGPNFKTRPDDRRGAPKGGALLDGAAAGGAGGRIGNPPYEPTPEQRREVETMAKVADEKTIATMLGISVSTLIRHYRSELDRGQAQAVVTVGGKLLQKALGGHSPSINFYLATRGKGAYSRRVEVTGAEGGAIKHVDLSRALESYTEEQLAILEPLLEQLIAAGGDDFDFRDQIGAPAGQGEEDGT